jgi:hypothetical protein
MEREDFLQIADPRAWGNSDFTNPFDLDDELCEGLNLDLAGGKNPGFWIMRA